jgi:hypothetical protein
LGEGEDEADKKEFGENKGIVGSLKAPGHELGS